MADDNNTKRTEQDRFHNSLNAMNAALADSGQNALKGAFLMNGGALVALLTFLSSLMGRDDGAEVVKALLPAMQGFAFGVASVGLAYGGTYLTNLLYTNSMLATDQVDDPPYLATTNKGLWFYRIGLAFHALTIIAALVSICSFFYGFNLVDEALKEL